MHIKPSDIRLKAGVDNQLVSRVSLLPSLLAEIDNSLTFSCSVIKNLQNFKRLNMTDADRILSLLSLNFRKTEVDPLNQGSCERKRHPDARSGNPSDVASLPLFCH